MMNKIADIAEPMLKSYGLTVYRNKPEMTLKEVVADSNGKNPDIHFAIHSNADNGKARGCEVYCYKFGGEGEKLARYVYAEMEKITPTEGRGVKESNNHFGEGKPLYEMAYTYAPAGLIEVAFHDNPEDAEWIMGHTDEIAHSIVKGILHYFGIDDSADVNAAYKEIIQNRCNFSHPEGVWEVIDTHKYADDLYRKWAESYKSEVSP